VRRPPAYIVKALRGYCRALGLEWCARIGAWYVTYEGRRLFTLQRASEPIRELDGCSDEVLAIVVAADNWRDGPDRLKAMARAARKREYEAKERERAAGDEARRHGEDMAGVFARGPKPFVQMRNNPLAATAAGAR
jgi:hypothetical protein